MTRKEQAEFVSDLCNGIKNTVVEQIRDNKIPPNWDGHELRCLVDIKAREAASRTEIRRSPKQSRAREFRNHVVIANL